MIENSNSRKEVKFFNNDIDGNTLETYSKSSVIAVDTEAMGLIHGRDRLCLVQISNKFKDIACIKINQGQNEAINLKNLLENDNIQKIFHYARFDVASLNCNLSIKFSNIFCTKIASKLARTYSPKHGLKDLINETCGVELDKQFQSSDWGSNETLSNNQINYASNDVRYLIQAKEKLEHMLKRENRYELALKCFQCIPTFADLDIQKYQNIFEH